VTLRLSSIFFHSLRHEPAEVPSAGLRLLIRAGYLRQLAPGRVCLLPLGVLLARSLGQLVRDEMAAIGAQEVQLPERRTTRTPPGRHHAALCMARS
jgi:prolyl-tRNA synthetase